MEINYEVRIHIMIRGDENKYSFEFVGKLIEIPLSPICGKYLKPSNLIQPLIYNIFHVILEFVFLL